MGAARDAAIRVVAASEAARIADPPALVDGPEEGLLRAEADVDEVVERSAARVARVQRLLAIQRRPSSAGHEVADAVAFHRGGVAVRVDGGRAGVEVIVRG